MDKSLLKKGSSQLGIALSENQISDFQILLEEMKKWGNKINITALLNNENRLIEELFIDSLAPLLFINNLNLENKSLLDIGSGGGFPGLPLKIADPSLTVTLSDSIEKKVFFIKHVIRKLKLEKTNALTFRFGSNDSGGPELCSFDFATSKAVTHIDQLSTWALPYLKKGGHLICLKSPQQDTLQPEGYNEVEPFSYFLPFSQAGRKLYIYKKI